MSWAASDTAVRKPLSCCGKKPLGMIDEQINRQCQRREEDTQRGPAASATPGRGRAHRHAASGRTPARSIGRSGRAWSRCCARRKRDAIIGVSVSDTTRRDEDRHRQRHRELAEQAADDAAHQKQRDQHRDQRNADRYDREPDFAGALERGGKRLLACST